MIARQRAKACAKHTAGHHLEGSVHPGLRVSGLFFLACWPHEAAGGNGKLLPRKTGSATAASFPFVSSLSAHPPAWLHPALLHTRKVRIPDLIPGSDSFPPVSEALLRKLRFELEDPSQEFCPRP